MNRILNKNILYALLAMLLLGGVWGCEDDGEVETDEVKLQSFGPSGVKPGEEIRFIGLNLDKVTSIEWKDASIPASAFTKQTSELITLTVPKEAGKGVVTLKTSVGDIVSKTELSFEAPVTIKGVTAEARPGSNITITGEYLNWVEGVRFARDTTVVQFVKQTTNELVITVPVTAQTGKLVVYSGGTEPLVIETEKELIVTAPAITAISPNPVAKGKNLTITGTNLDLAKSVLFAGTAAPVTKMASQSATQIVVTVPQDAVKGKISLITASNVAVQSKEEVGVGQ